MRVVHAAALTAAALLLASVASAQGLGDAAAREKEKRKAAPAKPAKVYTEGDIGRSMAPVEATPDLPATAEPAAEGQPPPRASLPRKGSPRPRARPPPKARRPPRGPRPPREPIPRQRPPPTPRRPRRRRGRRPSRTGASVSTRPSKEEAVYKDVIDKLQLELNDTSGGLYNPGRAAKIAFQEENKQKLAQTQGKIAALEEEGRRNRYQ